MTGISFGTDGWRGVMADDFTFANVRLVAQAIADHILGRGPGENRGREVVIGYDHRFLAERFAAAVADVFAARGLTVLLGERTMPTPVTAFAVVHHRAVGAVMLTASHNPPEYNGIKWIPEYGGPALPETTREIETHLHRRLADEVEEQGPLGATAAPRLIDPRQAYTAHVRGLIDEDAISRTELRVVVDPLWGAGVGYLESILGDMEVRVHAVHDYRDPLFGGSLPDPSEARLGDLRERVLACGADFGLALDGDADRLGIIDRDGSFISPNQLLTLVYHHLLTVRGMKGPAARTLPTTHMLDRLAEAFGTEAVETKVGFKYIGQSLMQRGCIVGGEESGGLSIKGHIPEKDGILAGLLAAEIMAVNGGKSFGELTAAVHEQYGALFSGRQDLRTTPENKQHVLEMMRDLRPAALAGRTVRERRDIDGLKLLLEDGSWVMVRASGTEPVFRIYAEAPTRQGVGEVQQALRAILHI